MPQVLPNPGFQRCDRQQSVFLDGILIGKRIWNLDQAIWSLQGRHRDMVTFADYLYTRDGATWDGFPEYMPGIRDGEWDYVVTSGRRFDREKFEEFKTRFYRFQGWDPATGHPSRDTLEALGLNAAADALEKRRCPGWPPRLTRPGFSSANYRQRETLIGKKAHAATDRHHCHGQISRDRFGQTRLGRQIGMEKAAELYREFVRIMLEPAGQLDLTRWSAAIRIIRFPVTGNGWAPDFSTWCSRGRIWVIKCGMRLNRALPGDMTG